MENFSLSPLLLLLIGRKTNDTDTYSNKIVLIANLPKEATFQIKYDFGLWEKKRKKKTEKGQRNATEKTRH